MKLIAVLNLVSLLILGLISSPAIAAGRMALVIGNSSYVEVPTLREPAGDAAAVAEKLDALGFAVTKALDRTKVELENTLKSFARAATGADVVVLFYSGHGLQFRGKNTLVPIDAKLRDAEDADFELIELQRVVQVLQEKATVALFFIDAARANPFIDRMHGEARSSATRGLARIETRNIGAMISLSAEPGTITEASNGRHSSYVTALLAHLDAPAMSISQVMTRVRRTVYDATEGKQIPREYNSLLEEFYLVPPHEMAVAEQRDTETAKLSQELAALQAELARLGDKTVSSSEGNGSVRLRIGEVVRDCDHCPPLVVVPVGSFLMGSPKSEDYRRDHEGPRQKITIGKPFLAGQYEVSVGEFKKYIQRTGTVPVSTCWEQPGFVQTANKPAICINWLEASDYVAWLAKTTKKPYRLLSESEWEYVARAGRQTMFSFGRKVTPRLANYDSWFHGRFAGATPDDQKMFAGTARVDSLSPNPFGLYHVHGNVSEWVAGCYSNSYEKMPSNGRPYQAEKCSLRVHRGGSWENKPWKLRSASRVTGYPRTSKKTIGFRVARNLLPSETVAPRLKGRELAEALQRELVRVGCLKGAVDGIWGRGSRNALVKFNRRTRNQMQTRNPTQSALDAVVQKAHRVCL